MQDKEEKRKHTFFCFLFHVILMWPWEMVKVTNLKLHTGYNKHNFILLRISLQLCLKRYHHFAKTWKHLSLTEFQIYITTFPQRMTTLALTPLNLPPPTHTHFPSNLTEITPFEWNWPVSTQRPWEHFTCKSVTSACILVKRSFRTLDRLVWKLPLSAWNCDVLNLLQASWMTDAPGWTSAQLDCSEI